MKVEEFKAWLEGFSESFTNNVPNKEQWDKIKNKINRIDNPTNLTYKPFYTNRNILVGN